MLKGSGERMHILVTGSTGFIGGALCHALTARGHQVRAFHRPSSSLKLLEGLAVEHAAGDLTQPDTIRQAMEGIDVVFHAAAQLNPNGNAGKAYAITVEGTRAVLAAAQEAGVRRVVHTSSVAALGVPDKGPRRPARKSTSMDRGFSSQIDENHTWNYQPSRWIYGYAKYLAELEVQKAVADGLDAVIVNPSLVFGPGDVYRMTSSLLVASAHNRIPPVSIPGGLNVVAIEDVIAGHLAALERGRRGERYILGGENICHADLLKMVAQITGVGGPRMALPAWLARSLALALRLGGAFTRLPLGADELGLAGLYFYYDTSKARHELGLPDPIPARQALESAYRWFKEQGAC
jgi:dihydroflavonol-4-reductase